MWPLLERGDGLEPHAAVDRLGGQGVPEPVRVDARDARRARDPAHDAGDPVPVQGAAVVGDQPLVPADVFEVRGGPVGEEPGQGVAECLSGDVAGSYRAIGAAVHDDRLSGDEARAG